MIVRERSVGLDKDVEMCENHIDESRYGSPKSTTEVTAIRKAGVLVKTQVQNSWAGSIWRDWARYQ